MTRWLMLLCVIAGCDKGALDYMKKSKMSESNVQFRKLEKSLKLALATDGVMPNLSVPLTPAEPCCSGPNHKCEPTPATWAAWQKLDFSIDEPHYFQYSIESIGAKVIIKAVGDLDCDGTTVTYTFEGLAQGDSLKATITEPTNPD